MMVSEPSSRIPPSTFSLSPLMTDVTVITVVMPMTIPRTVSADRSLFFCRVSRARRISSRNLSMPSLGLRTRSGSAAGCGKVFSKAAMKFSLLLRTQRFDRIELGGLGRRICAEEKPDAQSHNQPADHRPQLHGAWERKYPRYDAGDQDAAQNPNSAADHRDRRRFNQELKQNVAAARAQSFAHADFAGPLGHGNEHDIHDDNSADDQGNRSDGNHNGEKRAADVFPQRQKGVAGLDREIVRLGIGKMMAPSHDLADFIHGVLNLRCGTGARCDAQRILLRPVVLVIGGEGNDDPVVQGISQGGALLASIANHFARNIVPANLFSDRVDARHQVLYHVLSSTPND